MLAGHAAVLGGKPSFADTNMLASEGRVPLTTSGHHTQPAWNMIKSSQAGASPRSVMYINMITAEWVAPIPSSKPALYENTALMLAGKEGYGHEVARRALQDAPNPAALAKQLEREIRASIAKEMEQAQQQADFGRGESDACKECCRA
jgi:hypothetical protein